MKYIDAEKLVTEIERRYKEYHSNWEKTRDPYLDGKADALDLLLPFITSLQQEQPEMDLVEEITDKTRACCNCVNGLPKYPNCYCWQHKYCNTDEPYKIPIEDWIETAKTCKEFEFEVLKIQPL